MKNIEKLINECIKMEQSVVNDVFKVDVFKCKKELEDYKQAQNLQLQQTGVMARFNISEDELIKELEDKRICKLSDLPEDIYYLHRKETARWILEKYDVFKK